MVAEAGLELNSAGIYGVFATFIFKKNRFCHIYPIIYNYCFCMFSLKGNRKGKNKGNTKVDIGILFV